MNGLRPTMGDIAYANARDANSRLNACEQQLKVLQKRLKKRLK